MSVLERVLSVFELDGSDDDEMNKHTPEYAIVSHDGWDKMRTVTGEDGTFIEFSREVTLDCVSEEDCGCTPVDAYDESTVKRVHVGTGTDEIINRDSVIVEPFPYGERVWQAEDMEDRTEYDRTE